MMKTFYWVINLLKMIYCDNDFEFSSARNYHDNDEISKSQLLMLLKLNMKRE